MHDDAFVVGDEWDYVILSTVRSLPDYEIDPRPSYGWCQAAMGFICDPHQINVALTRARMGLIVIGLLTRALLRVVMLLCKMNSWLMAH